MTPELHGKIIWLKSKLESRGASLGLAESCTGGLLSAWLSEIPGISTVFKGAIVSYARQVKIELLDVKESSILAFGEVSEPVVSWVVIGRWRSPEWLVRVAVPARSRWALYASPWLVPVLKGPACTNSTVVWSVTKSSVNQRFLLLICW
jgi:hypothetical protein